MKGTFSSLFKRLPVPFASLLGTPDGSDGESESFRLGGFISPTAAAVLVVMADVTAGVGRDEANGAFAFRPAVLGMAASLACNVVLESADSFLCGSCFLDLPPSPFLTGRLVLLMATELADETSDTSEECEALANTSEDDVTSDEEDLSEDEPPEPEVVIADTAFFFPAFEGCETLAFALTCITD